MKVPRLAVIMVATFATGIVAFLPLPVTAEKGNSASRQVADTLDGIIQPLFQDDAGTIFGMDRLTESIQGHGPIIPHDDGLFVSPVWAPKASSTPWMPRKNVQEQVTRLDSQKSLYFVGFFHIAHRPGKPTDTTPDKAKLFLSRKKMQLTPLASSAPVTFPVFRDLVNLTGKLKELLDTSEIDKKYREEQKQRFYKAVRYSTPLVKQWQQIAVQNASTLQQGKATEVATGEWTLFLRPVKASKASCVSCHSGAKIGDTLGVMAYAVAPKK